MATLTAEIIQQIAGKKLPKDCTLVATGQFGHSFWIQRGEMRIALLYNTGFVKFLLPLWDQKLTKFTQAVQEATKTIDTA